MKRKRFSVEQIVAVLKQVEVGVPVVEVCRQAGITEQTFYRWKKQYVGLEIDQVQQSIDISHITNAAADLPSEWHDQEALATLLQTLDLRRHLVRAHIEHLASLAPTISPAWRSANVSYAA